MKTKSPVCWLIMVTLSLLLTSCASVHQTMHIAPVETTFPVSASQSLFINNSVIGDEQFQKSEPFTLSQSIKYPLRAKEIDLDLTSLLTKELSGTKFNGITQLKIEVKDIKNSTASLVAVERNIALWTSVLGLLYMSYSASIPRENGGMYYVPGIACMAAGAGILGGSFIHENMGTIVYKIDISGNKVIY